MLLVPNAGNIKTPKEELLLKVDAMDIFRDFYIIKYKREYKVIQINKVLKQTNMYNMPVFQILKSTYVYRIEGVVPENFNISENTLLLENACTSSIYTNHEKKISGGYQSSFYDKDVMSNEEFANMMMEMSSEVLPMVPPKYYTTEHMMSEYGEGNLEMIPYNLIWERSKKAYMGKELLDDLSVVHAYKDGKIRTNFDFDEDPLLSVYGDVIFDFISRICLASSESMITEVDFIYDTRMGNNVIYDKIDIPFMNNVYKGYIKSRLAGIIDIMSRIAKDIEKIHGAIRIMYRPTDITDSVEIMFLDKNTNTGTLTFSKDILYSSFLNDILATSDLSTGELK